MVRLVTDRVDKPMSKVWDGYLGTAREIVAWCRDGAGNDRFAYNPNLHKPDEAKVYVERPFPDSATWEQCPVGSVIVRADDTEDAPLTVLPPVETATLKESA